MQSQQFLCKRIGLPDTYWLHNLLVCCSHLLALHRTSVLRHDEHGQEALVNLLLRNYLHYNLYDQVGMPTFLLPHQVS